MQTRVARRYLSVLAPILLTLVVSGCGGGGSSNPSSPSRSGMIESELFASLSAFCTASDEMSQAGLADIFSPIFSAERENLNVDIQAYMQEENLGETIDYSEMMQYYDYLIAAQQQAEVSSTTTILEFAIEPGATSTEAVTRFRLFIQSTQDNVDDYGRMTWVKRNNRWRIASILPVSKY